MKFAELNATSNFSFLMSGAHPEEMVEAAAVKGLAGLAIADRNSLASAVRAHVAAKDAGLRLVIGARLDLADGPSLIVYPEDKAAYARLCRLLTLGRRRAPKGACHIYTADLAPHAEGLSALLLPVCNAADPPPDPNDETTVGHLSRLARIFAGRAWLALIPAYDGYDMQRLAATRALSARLGLKLAASNAPILHTPERRALYDVITCIREGVTLAEAGLRLLPHGEHHLKSAAELAAAFGNAPRAAAAIEETCAILDRCRFSLDDLTYDYPTDPLPPGVDPQTELERLSFEGAKRRYPDGVPETILARLRHELDLIGEMNYAPYFLTVWDIVRFARSRGILCQGRGSAANSAVCYCLFVTAVDPDRIDVLFERFISKARNEPPDIDVDFEHERREEVIQYIYETYGRDRAGLAASVICYRTRLAVREVGKALGLSQDVLAAVLSTSWSGRDGMGADHLRAAGLDPNEHTLKLTLMLADELRGFPRHLSQHVGGFVFTQGPLSDLVPVENAAMDGRTVIQWDKDDLDALGILKVDVLALGMLTCIRKAFDLIETSTGKRFDLATVPAEDPATYDMLSAGDSLGVFQVESRAQMTMLPRLKPREFYDLVIEVAIVRPGPIQGDMVHPYLRRRQGLEPVAYPSAALRSVLHKTLGVPLFQEQAMKIAIVAAGFSPEDADRLRRAMATFKRSGTLPKLRTKFIEGMKNNGYSYDFSEKCFRQIEGFGEYGFPESHAASFALLVYVSAWLKRHYPAAFAAALLNSQPMGFYAPAQIIRDAREHGVAVRPVDVQASFFDNSLESTLMPNKPALRLGMRQIKGFRAEDADLLCAYREGLNRPVRDTAELWRAGVPRTALERLARADAFASLSENRRDALWAVRGLDRAAPLPLFAALTEARPEPAVSLPRLSPGEEVVEDYAHLFFTLRQHPVALLRKELAKSRIEPARQLARGKNDRRLTVAGLAICRQRPGSARGVIFITLEDETGVANLIVRPPVFERHRRTVLTGQMLACTGRLQREGAVIHVVADTLTDLSPWLARLSPDEETMLAPATARADRLRHHRALHTAPVQQDSGEVHGLPETQTRSGPSHADVKRANCTGPD